MALISLLTDYGLKDAYVSNIKAKLWSEIDNVKILDISHQVDKFHIPQAAYYLQSNLNFFGENDIHIIDVCHAYVPHNFVIAKSRKGTFIAPNNGLLATLEIEFTEVIELENTPSSFYTLTHIVPLVKKIVDGIDISSLGKKITELQNQYQNELSISDNLIIGHISHIDSYGNLITDIPKEIIELYQAGRDIEIKVGRERINRISPNYKTGVEANCIAIYNNQHFLEIAITEANAAKLLGKSFGDTVSVRFR